MSIYTQRGQRGLPYDSVVYVIPQENTDPDQYGRNFIQAYRAAAAKRPGGLPLSATNRASVVVLGCLCRWGSGAFVMDTNFVDIVGLDPATCVLVSNGTTVRTTADDYRISGITIRTTGQQAIRPTTGDPAAYFPTGPSGGHVLDNVVLEQTQLLANLTRFGEGYSGRYNVEAKAPTGASVYCFEGTCTGFFNFTMRLVNAGQCFVLGGNAFSTSPAYGRIDIDCANSLLTSVINIFGHSFSGGGEFLRVRLASPSALTSAGTINCAVAPITGTTSSTISQTGAKPDCTTIFLEAREINAFGAILNPTSLGVTTITGFRCETFTARFDTLRAFGVTLNARSATIQGTDRYSYWGKVSLERITPGPAVGGQLYIFAVARQAGPFTTRIANRQTVNEVEFVGQNMQFLADIAWFATGVSGSQGQFDGTCRNFILPRSPFFSVLRSRISSQFGQGSLVSGGELTNWDTLVGITGPCAMLFNNCIIRGNGAQPPIPDARNAVPGPAFNFLLARFCTFAAETSTNCINSTTTGINIKLQSCVMNKTAPIGSGITNLIPTGVIIDVDAY